MKNKIKIYDIFVLLISIRTWLSITKLFDSSKGLENVLNIIIAIVFILVVISKKYTRKDLIYILGLFCLVLLTSYLTKSRTIVLAFLGLIAIKDMDLKHTFKMILVFNVSMFLLHVGYTLICYIFSPEQIPYIIHNRGYRSTFFMRHPNYAGAVILWSIAAYTYIFYNKITKITYVCIIILAFVANYFTKSRTTLIGFIVLLVLLLFRNREIFKNIIIKTSKYLFPVLAAISIFLCVTYNELSPTVNKTVIELNERLSQRLKLGHIGYESYGSTIFGQYVNYVDEFSTQQYTYSNLIVDSFYMNCFINYGMIYLFLLSIGIYKLCKNNDYRSVVYIVLFCIVAFTEKYMIYEVIAFPMFMIAYMIFSDKIVYSEVGEK